MRPPGFNKTGCRASRFITSVYAVAILVMEISARTYGTTQSHGHQSRNRKESELFPLQLLLRNGHDDTNVTTQIGTTAYLPCKVHSIFLETPRHVTG